MSAEYLAKNVANGRASNTLTTVYTVPAGKRAIITSIICVNTDGSSERSFTLYANFGSGDRAISPVACRLQAGALYEQEHSVALEEGDALKIVASTDNVIDFVLSGVEA